MCWRDTVLNEAQTLLPLQYPLNDSWENSQDALENQNLSQDSAQIQNYLASNSKTEVKEFDKNYENNSIFENNKTENNTKNNLDSKSLFENSVNQSLEKNQSTVLHQKFPQDNVQIESFPEFSKKRELDFDLNHEDERNVINDRPLKKVKSVQSNQADFENKSNSCTKFFSNIDHYLEKQTGVMEADVQKNTSSDNDENLLKDHASHTLKSVKGNSKFISLKLFM